MNKPLISVCIPAYNRSSVLPTLLDSVFAQDFEDYNVIICEDQCPEQATIRNIVKSYQERYPGKIQYHENEKNLGYDGNIRRLAEKADGKYLFYMGNDDIMAPLALKRVADAVTKYPNVGAILRTYASFDDNPNNLNQVFRYFEGERFFPAGADTVSAFFRRFVVISGDVLHREESLKYSTPRFDGVLLYQLYLVAQVLTTKNGVSIPDVLTYYRNGGIPEFGNSDSEKGKFIPKSRTWQSSLHFLKGMLDIAKYVNDTRKIPIYKKILKDLGNYSYPFIALQFDKGRIEFLKYVYNLSKLGFYTNPFFYMYTLGLLLVGPKHLDNLIRLIKKKVGKTPLIGNVYKGQVSNEQLG